MKTYGRKKTSQRCTQLNFDLRELCRLCLCTSSDKCSIFESLSDVPLPIKIFVCLSIEVYEGDGLPSGICFKCLKLLDTFYKFRKKCEELNSKLNDISKKFKEVHPQEKLLQQKQEVNRKLSIVELLYGADKEAEGGLSLNESKCVMNSLLIDCENEEGNVSSSFQEEPLTHSANNSYNNNNSATLTANDAQCEIVSVSRSDCVGDWQVSENVISETTHFSVSENTSLCNENVPVDDVQNISTRESVSNNTNEHSKSVPLNNNVNSEPLPIASGELIFMCEKCPKAFSKRVDLKRHSSVHDQRGYECNQCEKWFPNKTSFKRHERIHTGERPFSCTYCQKSFSQVSILSRHMLIHSGDKPYKCDICGKAFTQREGLKVHMRQHDRSNQQRYYCPLCMKTFSHQSGLSRHLVAHTGKTFDCSVCSKSFSDQSSLKRHLKRHGTFQNGVGT